MKELISCAMDCLGVAVTIIDPKGIILYYNSQAAKILDRKPEYIGCEVYNYHKKPESNDKIKSMIHDFKNSLFSPLMAMDQPQLYCQYFDQIEEFYTSIRKIIPPLPVWLGYRLFFLNQGVFHI